MRVPNRVQTCVDPAEGIAAVLDGRRAAHVANLLSAVLAATADVRSLSWSSGLPDNNGGDTCSA